MRNATVRSGASKFEQHVTIGPHALRADAPKEHDGGDVGPEPHEFLLAALGSCTSISLQMYAARKAWPLTGVKVDVRLEKTADGTVFHRSIELEGGLDGTQRERLLEIANKCPVHATLSGKIQIATKLS